MRRFFARFVTSTVGVSDQRIVEAFATIRREIFVGPAPWHIQVLGGYIVSETDDPVVLYQDVNIGLDPARRINNGQPSLHAKCLGAVAPQPGEVVLHIGAGTGYYTALLARLVGPGGRVHAYEIDRELAARATRNLTACTNVAVHETSGLEADLPSADVIYVSAGATHVPSLWLKALSLGGRLLLPLTPNDGPGFMLLVTRRSSLAYEARSVSPAFFIPCEGARDDQQSVRLAAAVRTRSTDDIRSLRIGNEPDESAWCVGAGCWLSTAPPPIHGYGYDGA